VFLSRGFADKGVAPLFLPAAGVLVRPCALCFKSFLAKKE